MSLPKKHGILTGAEKLDSYKQQMAVSTKLQIYPETINSI